MTKDPLEFSDEELEIFLEVLAKREIFRKCRVCGRTLTGTYEKSYGACATFIMCTDRKRHKSTAEMPRKVPVPPFNELKNC